MHDKLYVVTGPTASGKTSYSIELAQRIGTEIVSADSRQLYRDIPIGTAQPTAEELAAVPHHLVGVLELEEYYSAAQFEQDALRIIEDIFRRCGGRAVVCGGSMMYIDALCYGIDPLPTVGEENRRAAYLLFQEEGLGGIIRELERVDPKYLLTAPDLKNHKRMIHALEVSWEAGQPYTSLLTGKKRRRPFEIERIVLDHPREVLFDRINRRVDQMMADGLLDEARRVYPLRHLNSLNTVGYKELFSCFDGQMDITTAVARIQKNTRVYAKKQLTWLKRR